MRCSISLAALLVALPILHAAAPGAGGQDAAPAASVQRYANAEHLHKNMSVLIIRPPWRVSCLARGQPEVTSNG